MTSLLVDPFRQKIAAIVIGASAGGMGALRNILPKLSNDLRAAVFVVQHMSPQQENFLVPFFREICALPIHEVEDKSKPEPGHIYFAVPDFHVLLENDRTFALSREYKVNYSRPSIDVLFESAAETYLYSLAGVVLTGANNDGSSGLKRIKELGGLTIVQDPETAEVASMPQAAIQAADPHLILPLSEIAPLLNQVARRKKA